MPSELHTARPRRDNWRTAFSLLVLGLDSRGMTMEQFEDSISKSTPVKRVSWYALLELAEQVIYRHTNGTLAGPGDSRTINELADMAQEINRMEGRRSKYPTITRPATAE